MSNDETSKTEVDRGRGMYPKFRVERTDPEAQERHEDCRVFVLEAAHDPHARPALAAYSASCAEDFPLLAADINRWLNDLVGIESDRPMATQPAPEHHVGTLDLSGEGNAPAAGFLLGDGVIDAAAQAACEHVYPPKTHKRWDAVDDFEQDAWRATANVVLESAYPAIRQQVAEEIAVALEAVPAEVYPEDFFPADGISVDCQSARVMRFAYPAAARIARDIGGQDLDHSAPGSTGTASGRIGLSASPSDPQAGKAGRIESGGSKP